MAWLNARSKKPHTIGEVLVKLQPIGEVLVKPRTIGEELVKQAVLKISEIMLGQKEAM